MLTRIQQIIADARHKLGDVNAERWTDARLLRLVSLGQKDVAKQTKLLKGSCTILLQEGKYMYDLPENVWEITRVTYNDAPISFETYDSMDDFVETLNVNKDNTYSKNRPVQYANIDLPRQTWENDEGTEPLAIIYDNRNMDSIRVYPIPKNVTDVTYTVESAGPIEFVGDDLMGIVVAIDDYTFNMPYGVLVDLYDPTIEEENFSSAYGIVSDIGESDKIILIRYIRVSADILSDSDTLELPKVYDEAIMYYVVAHAYEDDLTTQSMEKANRAQGFYKRETDIVASTVRRDGVNSAKQFEGTYRGPFNA